MVISSKKNQEIQSFVLLPLEQFEAYQSQKAATETRSDEDNLALKHKLTDPIGQDTDSLVTAKRIAQLNVLERDSSKGAFPSKNLTGSVDKPVTTELNDSQLAEDNGEDLTENKGLGSFENLLGFVKNLNGIRRERSIAIIRHIINQPPLPSRRISLDHNTGFICLDGQNTTTNLTTFLYNLQQPRKTLSDDELEILNLLDIPSSLYVNRHGQSVQQKQTTTSQTNGMWEPFFGSNIHF